MSLHSPSVPQVRTDVPANSYPELQVYVAIPCGAKPVISTTPFSGFSSVSHPPTAKRLTLIHTHFITNKKKIENWKILTSTYFTVTLGVTI